MYCKYYKYCTVLTSATFRLIAVQALLVVDGTGICYYEGHPSQSKEGAGLGRLGLPQGDGDEDGYN